MKLSVRFNADTRTPLRAVEWILSLLAIIGGGYVMSPLLSYSTAMFGAGAIAQTITHPVGIFAFGLIFFVSGVVLIIGLVKNNKKLRGYGLLAHIACRVYALIGTWLTVGFLPLGWLSSLGLVLIAIVIYLTVKSKRLNI